MTWLNDVFETTRMWLGLGQTLYMVSGATLLAYLFGLPLGVIVVLTDEQGLYPHPRCNRILQGFINLFRSIPFIILLVLMIPVTRAIVGTSIGSTAMIMPLAVAATAFVARVVESSLREVDHGIIEQAVCMGTPPLQIVWHAYLGEALPSLIRGLSITAINLIGYSAMAGTVAGGGLGDIAIRFGYHRYDETVMLVTVVLLILVVQLIQWGFTLLSKTVDKRYR